MDKYTEVKEIGQGAFGRAFHVKLKSTQEDFVIKKIKSELITPKIKEETTKEVTVLKQLQHENIVSYIESFEDRGCLHIVMSYCSEGNLAVKIHKRRNNLFQEQEICTTFCQLCQAVEYMHSKNILHRDIKPENIFLTSHGIIKLGDFGLSRILDSTLQYARTIAGTLCYIAPEILDGKQYKNKCDMWSLGCVLYELTTLKRAFINISSLISGQFSPVSSEYSHDLHDLIAELLRVNPEDRPSANDVLAMVFIRAKIDSDQILEDSSSAAAISDLDLFLIGGRRNGRSATGNTILGIHGAFKESNHFESENRLVTGVKWCRRGQVILKVVDGPCLMEGQTKLKSPLEAFVHCPRGFHALLFVLNFACPRWTASDNSLVIFLKQTLGKDIIKNRGILVITHGECFDLYTTRREWMTFETWCQKQEGGLGDLIKECGNRVILFYNLTPTKHEESVNKLITIAHGFGKLFTCEFLKGVKSLGDHALGDTGVMPESVLARIDLCVNDLRKYLDKQKLSDYQHFKGSATNLLAQIQATKEQWNKGTKEHQEKMFFLQSLVKPLAGRDRITSDELYKILLDLEKTEAPYREITIRNSNGISKCSIA